MMSSLRNKFLKIFGDIKVFKFPFFMLYNPGGYKVKGEDVRAIINTVQKGDILVRGYANYLDGYFIPGFFSHVGLYLGNIDKKPDNLKLSANAHFKTGEQMVIHSMADGVFMEDIINFCRCDYLLILRRNAKTEDNFQLEESFKITLEKAMQNLGKPYDFVFNFTNKDKMSCTELVYNCTDDYINQYQVFVKNRNVFFKKREIIIPDDFITSKFDIPFVSGSVPKNKISNILQVNANG